MRDRKTTLVGLVLIAVGSFLAIQAKKATPDVVAMLTTGAGFIAAADSKEKQ